MRFCGLASWWAGWACGSQGGYGYMVFLVILGTLSWGAGTIWSHARRGPAGATLVSCCRQLRDAGAAEIGVIATHGLFTGEHWRALLADGVRQIWVTDTVLSRRRPAQARVVPVAALLGPALAGSSD